VGVDVGVDVGVWVGTVVGVDGGVAVAPGETGVAAGADVAVGAVVAVASCCGANVALGTGAVVAVASAGPMDNRPKRHAATAPPPRTNKRSTIRPTMPSARPPLRRVRASAAG
jgi:hypothetical protein